MDELQMLMKVSKDDDYFREHHTELQEKYTNEFVAVENGEVMDHNSSMKALVESLKSKQKNPALLLIKFVHEKGKIRVL